MKKKIDNEIKVEIDMGYIMFFFGTMFGIGLSGIFLLVLDIMGCLPK